MTATITTSYEFVCPKCKLMLWAERLWDERNNTMTCSCGANMKRTMLGGFTEVEL
jgi:hypothetical protein